MRTPELTQPLGPPQSPASPCLAPVYQPPRVQSLGRWQAVTLIQSVPVNPGGYFNGQRRD